jgi:hypothetical protein
MSAARFKGLVLLNARDFCVERFGIDGWSHVVDALATEERDVVDAAVHVGWYDIALYDHVHEAIDSELGRGDGVLMRSLGHWCAERDLTTVHRMFMRLLSPSFLLKKYGDYWKRYQDSGEWNVVREDERRIRATLSRWGSVSEPTCIRLGAYIEKMLELSGGRGALTTRPKCRSRGDAACEYVVEWREGPPAPSG